MNIRSLLWEESAAPIAEGQSQRGRAERTADRAAAD